MHQGGATTPALGGRDDAERAQPEGRRAERLQPPAGGDDVPDDGPGVDGDQRQVRQEAGVLPELVDQPRLRHLPG
ncbi:hypothetical protein [Blastococcus sp. TF02A-35]|uniref:hypothetical protein n=1 Tax=Blastococcus sp. TF02A-35 TaxID=2559612 RepID=UPI001FD79761|nr:hypothetical protein [Blastococcus sp. TF02A_35]